MKVKPFMSYNDFFLKVTTVNDANYTALTSDEIILVTSGSTANRTITLPTAVGRKGKYYIIKKVDNGTKYAIIDGHEDETIDGSATLSLSAQYNVALIISDGTNWHVITKTVG